MHFCFQGIGISLHSYKDLQNVMRYDFNKIEIIWIKTILYLVTKSNCKYFAIGIGFVIKNLFDLCNELR